MSRSEYRYGRLLDVYVGTGLKPTTGCDLILHLEGPDGHDLRVQLTEAQADKLIAEAIRWKRMLPEYTERVLAEARRTNFEREHGGPDPSVWEEP